MKDVELGQLLFSNGALYNFDADWATDGLVMIAQTISEYRGKDPFGGWTNLTSNSGDEEFVNDVFEMRSYCWCDATWEENPEHPHANGCPPNFLYKPNGFAVTWYKHAARGITANKEFPGMKKWFEVISNCIGSVK